MKQIKTEKFTETSLSVRWFVPLERKDITAWNLLNAMLSRSTEKYSSREAAGKASAMAYGTRCAYSLCAYGNYLRIEYGMRFLRENLIGEKSYTALLIDLFDQYLFHPLLTQPVLDEAKYLLRLNLSSMAQQPDLRSLEMAFQAFTDYESVSIPIRGAIEDIDRVTLEDIRSLYSRLMKTPCEMISCGTFSEEFSRHIDRSIDSQDIFTTWEKVEAFPTPVRVSEEREIAQSALCQVYTTDILPDDDDYYALLVLDSLLGGSSVSLLFEEVREKNSLCYSISTSLVRFSGLLLITTGAAHSALPKVEELVRHILEQVKNKEVDPATFEMVKAEMIDSLKGQSDSAARMIEQEFLNQILHRTGDIGDVIESVRAVTLDDVARAAGKLKLAVTSSVMQAEAKGPQGKEQYAA